ncbi:M12 family metallopeptidase [Tahibacter harae]|uniref:M12 family metallopeptidase n=1 Tax=Tahibacter harae TaxID=2963937 RepID=A0ABT1QP38_9GAMM|nr:M12 family metallopeptidase [Tahibacter harae]MCQ4163890.1 M12 family metallopeptidase [Tahibacter harae]
MSENDVIPHDHRFCSSLEDIGFQTPAANGLVARAALLNAAFWGRGVKLRVSFLDGAPELHRRVAALAQAWPQETGANFSFEFWIGNGLDPAGADIRVAFQPGIGSFSRLGRFAQAVDRRERTMNLGWMTMALPEDEARAVVLHEFGHALGLVHEHMNPARPIDWNKEKVRQDLRASQGWSDDKIDANMFHRYDPGQIFGTDVDAASIMMYPILPSWTRNGFAAGFNTVLSEADKALIRKAYGLRPVFGG